MNKGWNDINSYEKYYKTFYIYEIQKCRSIQENRKRISANRNRKLCTKNINENEKIIKT